MFIIAFRLFVSSDPLSLAKEKYKIKKAGTAIITVITQL